MIVFSVELRKVSFSFFPFVLFIIFIIIPSFFWVFQPYYFSIDCDDSYSFVGVDFWIFLIRGWRIDIK